MIFWYPRRTESNSPTVRSSVQCSSSRFWIHNPGFSVDLPQIDSLTFKYLNLLTFNNVADTNLPLAIGIFCPLGPAVVDVGGADVASPLVVLGSILVVPTCKKKFRGGNL